MKENALPTSIFFPRAVEMALGETECAQRPESTGRFGSGKVGQYAGGGWRERVHRLVALRHEYAVGQTVVRRHGVSNGANLGADPCSLSISQIQLPMDVEGVIAFSGNRFYCFSHEMGGKHSGEPLHPRRGLVSTGNMVFHKSFHIRQPCLS